VFSPVWIFSFPFEDSLYFVEYIFVKPNYTLAAEFILAQFPFWCSILELVRTHFAACGGEEVPPRKNRKAAEPHR